MTEETRRQKHAEINRRWREKNPEKNRKIYLECNARHQFGLSRAEQEELHKKVCDICGSRAKKMCIDHLVPKTHRGVLCQQCNSRLGWLEKRLDTILAYIKREPCTCRVDSTTDTHDYRN